MKCAEHNLSVREKENAKLKEEAKFYEATIKKYKYQYGSEI